MKTQTENVAENIWSWFDNYASLYEFDSTVQFEDFSLEDLKKVDADKMWEILAPKLKELVVSYVEGEIEDRENE